MMKKIIALATIVATLAMTGCAGRVVDPVDASVTHPKGVVYYDASGKLQDKVPEAVSPEAQDGWETFALTVGTVAGVAGTALGIVALTQ